MAKENGEWEAKEVKNFIWERLCKSENGRFDFAPLLLDEDGKSPNGPKFAEIVDVLKDHEYITDSRPDYQHYWIELKGNGRIKCKDKV